MQRESGRGCRQRHERYGRFLVWSSDPGPDAGLLSALLPNPDRLFAQGEVRLSPWQGPGTDKVRLTLSGHDYFLKRYNRLGTVYGIKNLLRRSRAVKSWMAARLFAKCGVPTPQPLLCLEERWCGLLGRSYLLFPFLKGEAASFLDLWPCLDTDQRQRCLEGLGRIIGCMHHQGLLHGDLNWRNIIALRREEMFCFWLVDLDGSRSTSAFAPARARKDLAHFLRDLDRAGAPQTLYDGFLGAWQKAIARR